MAKFKLDFRPTRRTIKASQRRINSAAKTVANEMATVIKKSISRQGPPRSRPGRPPRKDSGALHLSVKGTARNGIITISTINYGVFLEGGTSNMSPRPFVRPVLFGQGKRQKWTARIRKLAENK